MIVVTRIVSATLENLVTAAELIANGGIIAYPTDTVYGLGCNPFDVKAVRKIIEVKDNRSKPLPVLVETITAAESIVTISEKALRLAKRYWPGPLTMILEAKPQVPSILAPDGSLGVRSPKHPICLRLLGLCSGMLVGTSANRTGYPPAATAADVVRELGDKLDLVLDGGRATIGVASTVIDLRRGLIVLREGPISRDELLNFIHSAG